MAKLICEDGTEVEISKETELSLRTAFGNTARVWKHGDVFKFQTKFNHGVMIYLEPAKKLGQGTVKYIDRPCDVFEELEHYLVPAIFLFNINDKR